MAVLLSIHPQYAESILSGDKKYELRRAIPKKNTDKDQLVLLYATAPVKKIVGSFYLAEILSAPLRKLWKWIRADSGVTLKEYKQYFAGKNVGFAIRVDNAIRLQTPIDPWRKDPTFVPPQSFRYLPTSVLRKWGVSLPPIISCYE